MVSVVGPNPGSRARVGAMEKVENRNFAPSPKPCNPGSGGKVAK